MVDVSEASWVGPWVDQTVDRWAAQLDAGLALKTADSKVLRKVVHWAGPWASKKAVLSDCLSAAVRAVPKGYPWAGC